MAQFLWFVADGILMLLTFVIIASAIMSWLVAFNVVNPRNSAVYQIGRFLEAVTEPILWPIRKVVPLLGGIDVSPVFALLIIEGLRRYILPMIFGPLIGVLG